MTSTKRVELGDSPKKENKGRMNLYNLGIKALEEYSRILGIPIGEILGKIKNEGLKLFVYKNEPQVMLQIGNNISEPSLIVYAYDQLTGKTLEGGARPIETAISEYYLGCPNPTQSELELLQFLLSNNAARFLWDKSRTWVNPIKVLKRLQKPLVIFFQPWGCCYSERTKLSKRALESLNRNEFLLNELEMRGMNPKLLVMMADTYAIDINGWPKDLVMRFYSNLKDAIGDMSANFEVIYWSDIVSKNKGLYSTIKGSIKNDSRTTEPYYEEALNSAFGFSKNNPYISAAEYVVERLVEGQLIDKLYEPVKLSLSSRSKDVTDGPLPVIYPRGVEQFPWLDVGVELDE
jgi:hypothetical protein